MQVPEKPSLDGLEAKWDEWWEASGTYRFDRTKTREQIYAIDTPPPTVSGSLHVGHVVSYTHTDLMARFKRMRGLRGLLSDGLGRQRPADRAPRAELLRRALRPDAALRPGASTSDAGATGPTSRPVVAAQLHRALRAADGRGREGVRGPLPRLGLSVDWTLRTPRSASASRRISQLAFLRLLRAGLAYTPRRRRCGTSTSEPRSRRPRSRTASTTAPTTGSRSTARTAPARSRSRRRGRSCIPACVALVAHPADERYRRSSARRC